MGGNLLLPQDGQLVAQRTHIQTALVRAPDRASI